MSIWPVILTAGLACELACSGTQPPPVAQVDAVALFSVALKTCVTTSQTMVEFRACEANVESLYCGDGGLLAWSSGCGKDGGQ